MRKSLASILVLISLFLSNTPAQAQKYYSMEEVRAQAQAGWHKTYQAHGRSIQIDIKPHVLSVMTVPLIQCYLPDFPPDISREAGFIHIESAAVKQDNTEPAVILSKGIHDNCQWDGHYADIPVTLQETVSLANQTAKESGLGADFIYRDKLYGLQEFSYVDGNRRSILGPGVLHVQFFQNLGGIPVVGDLNKSYIALDQGFRGPGSAMPRLSAYVEKNAEHFSFSGNFLVAERTRLAEDVPLASFDRIISAMEKEISAGRLRQVFDLNFGYTLMPDKANHQHLGESGNVFYAVPTWVLDCLYVRDAQQKIKPRQEDDASCADIYERPEFRRLIINAQTAKILDPLSKDRSRFKFSGFLSWKDVQKGIKK